MIAKKILYALGGILVVTAMVACSGNSGKNADSLSDSNALNDSLNAAQDTVEQADTIKITTLAEDIDATNGMVPMKLWDDWTLIQVVSTDNGVTLNVQGNWDDMEIDMLKESTAEELSTLGRYAIGNIFDGYYNPNARHNVADKRAYKQLGEICKKLAADEKSVEIRMHNSRGQAIAHGTIKAGPKVIKRQIKD